MRPVVLHRVHSHGDSEVRMYCRKVPAFPYTWNHRNLLSTVSARCTLSSVHTGVHALSCEAHCVIWNTASICLLRVFCLQKFAASVFYQKLKTGWENWKHVLTGICSPYYEWLWICKCVCLGFKALCGSDTFCLVLGSKLQKVWLFLPSRQLLAVVRAL